MDSCELYQYHSTSNTYVGNLLCDIFKDTVNRFIFYISHNIVYTHSSFKYHYREEKKKWKGYFYKYKVAQHRTCLASSKSSRAQFWKKEELISSDRTWELQRSAPWLLPIPTQFNNNRRNLITRDLIWYAKCVTVLDADSDRTIIRPGMLTQLEKSSYTH